LELGRAGACAAALALHCGVRTKTRFELTAAPLAMGGWSKSLKRPTGVHRMDSHAEKKSPHRKKIKPNQHIPKHGAMVAGVPCG